MKAKLARFYGWSPDQIDSLDVQSANLYWQCIDQLEAGEVILSFTIHDYPNLTQDKREALFKRFEKRMNPVRKSEGKKLTNKELMQILSRR
jgi:hypothetical protein